MAPNKFFEYLIQLLDNYSRFESLPTCFQFALFGNRLSVKFDVMHSQLHEKNLSSARLG